MKDNVFNGLRIAMPISGPASQIADGQCKRGDDSACEPRVSAREAI
jgi:hypothetical protein